MAARRYEISLQEIIGSIHKIEVSLSVKGA